MPPQVKFVCKKGFAVFVDIKNLIREENLDGNHNESTCKETKTTEKQDATQEQITEGDSLRSMSYYGSSGKSRHVGVFLLVTPDYVGVVQLVQNWFNLFVCVCFFPLSYKELENHPGN